MPQDRESGARGRNFGYHMAQRVAQALGATLINPGRSNEAVWNKTRVVLKAAHRRVPQIGATVAILDRVDWVLAALEDEEGSFTLYKVSSAWFKEQMAPSRSPKAAHVMMVNCNKVRDAGTVVGRL